jgi:rhodanese-related sulfurtransferase
MPRTIDARTVKGWLVDGRELAFIDVREAGQYGEGHPFHATSVPYSRFEPELVRLVPNVNARMVLLDAGDGIAERAAAAAEALGFRNVHVLDGGADGWSAAGYTLFKGVNVPSKTFGELLEHARHTPRITAAELARLQASGAPHVIVDGRPFTEYRRMSIPGGICCPNGELALHIHEIAPDPSTPIIVNCAGRTRSILGAETLRAVGVPNPVMALENGTQGWFLEGLELERGATRRHSLDRPPAPILAERSSRARAVAESRGVRFVAADQVARWLGEADRTTFVLDVRTPEEHAAEAYPAFQHAPGGQLVQATDQWVGVMRARIVFADSDGVRAPMMAQWLAQLGHDMSVLEGGVAAGAELPRPAAAPRWTPARPARTTAADLAGPARDDTTFVDVRASFDYRRGHIPGAIWSIRPRLGMLCGSVSGRRVVVVSDSDDVAALAAADLQGLGAQDIRTLEGGMTAWTAGGYPVQSSPGEPSDEACIDFLFFVHDRHEGNIEAARGYIAWEMGLLAQLDADERAVFRIAT